MSAIGIDIGGTKLLAVRLGEGGRLAGSPLHVPAPRSPDELVAAVLDAARRLSDDGRPGSIGVGVPGLVDAGDTLVFAPNLQGAAGATIGAALRQGSPGAKVWVGNDATAAAWGEYSAGAGAGAGAATAGAGAATAGPGAATAGPGAATAGPGAATAGPTGPAPDMLMVTLGTGIGGGIVVGGRLAEGAHRFAGEFGHMVVDPNGPQCPCGKRGCWERFASGAGLGVLARELAMAGGAPELSERAGGDPEDVKGEHVTAAAAAGDPAAVEIMRRFGWWVALGLANLANLFDPDLIVVGGGLVEAGEVLMEPVRRAFDDLIEAGGLRPMPAVVPAALGPRAGAIGAGLLAANAPERGGTAH